jgi:hypothetical protein
MEEGRNNDDFSGAQRYIFITSPTAGLKFDTAGLKFDTAGLKFDTAGLKFDTAGLKFRPLGLQQSMGARN